MYGLCGVRLCLPPVVAKVWEESEADAHDHKGPARTKTFGAMEVRRSRGLQRTSGLCRIWRGTRAACHWHGQRPEWVALADDQRLQSALCLVRDRPVAGVPSLMVCEKTLRTGVRIAWPGRGTTLVCFEQKKWVCNLAPSWPCVSCLDFRLVPHPRTHLRSCADDFAAGGVQPFTSHARYPIPPLLCSHLALQRAHRPW